MTLPGNGTFWDKFIDTALKVYGPLAIVSAFFAWQNTQKDEELKRRYEFQVVITERVIQALADTAESNERLAAALERRSFNSTNLNN